MIALCVKRVVIIHLYIKYVSCYNDVTDASCAVGDLSVNSKCNRKFHSSSPLSWYSASNDCLSRGGSLAVFADVGRPSDNSQLTDWLNTTAGRTHVYWIGLMKSWWQITNKGALSGQLCNRPVYCYISVHSDDLVQVFSSSS